jgi:uncharacterized protein (TIGR03435 family)
MRTCLHIGIAALATVLAYGQPSPKLEFEVASIKLSETPKPGQPVFFGPAKGGPGTEDPEHIVWSFATLRAVLLTAFDMKAYQLTGPMSLDADRYNFAVKIPAGATKEQVRTMWVNLLAERFGMKLHHESKEFQVDELVVGKDGPKLKLASADVADAPAGGPPNIVNGELKSAGFITMIHSGPTGVTAQTMAKGQTLEPLAVALSGQLKHPVLDKTGLTAKYDYTVDFTPDMSGFSVIPAGGGPPPANPTGAADLEQTLGVAIQQQLGLRLTKGKANLDTVVIDKVDKAPTAN